MVVTKKQADLDIRIDANRLDEEWINHPHIYFRYAAQVADAEEEMRRAKTNIDLVDAELDRAIRSDPSKFGLEKLTEPTVKAAIARHKKHTDAQDVYYEVKHEHDILQAAVSALDHRKRALEKLVDLHLANYFSKPTAAKGASKERMDETEKRITRNKGRIRRED